MKFEICVTVVLLMVGACSAEKLTDRIDKLAEMAEELKAIMEQMKAIGQQTVGKLDKILVFYDAKSGTNTRQCLFLEVLRNGEGKNFLNEIRDPNAMKLSDTLPGLPLPAINAKIRVLRTKIANVVQTSEAYTVIGRSRVGLLQHVIAVGREAICPNHDFLCPGNYTFNRHTTGGCYEEQLAANVNYNTALAICHARRGHLPYITSENENKNITFALQPGTSTGNYVNHCMWLGVKRNSDGEWKHHEEDLDFNKWMEDPKAEGGDCAYYCLKSKMWMQVPCDTQKCRVLCETDPLTT